MQCPWGQKAFTGYLGEDRRLWARHDATELMTAAGDRSSFPEILIDQGDADNFLQDQLKPHLFQTACQTAGQPLNLRLQPGYDHSYFFISTFMDDHLKHHAGVLDESL
jgi:S-formylglutathione hydrolase